MRNVFTEVQEKLLEELESGKHRQADSVLIAKDEKDEEGNCEGDGFSYCCLGVAARFALGEEPERTDLGWNFGGSPGVLTLDQTERLNLHSGYGVFKHGCTAPIAEPSPLVPEHSPLYSLSEMNDWGLSFKEIAAFIRKTPWAVFTNFDPPSE